MTRFVLTTCVLLHREGRWLLTVRGPGAFHAPNLIGLVGGRVELGDGTNTLEVNARREVWEETGIDLLTVPLRYLASEQFTTEAGEPVVDVTFLAEVPVGVEGRLTAPDELTAVGWWTEAELVADSRCPPWMLRLVRLGADAVNR